MKILIDADACPVIRIIEDIARERNIPVIILCDTSHIISSDYSKVINISKGTDAVDFALFSHIDAGDIAVTQDYGVAAMVLGKKAYAIHQSGLYYTEDNIDQMLFERHMSKKARRGSQKFHSCKHKKRSSEDDERFRASLIRLIEDIS